MATQMFKYAANVIQIKYGIRRYGTLLLIFLPSTININTKIHKIISHTNAAKYNLNLKNIIDQKKLKIS